MVCPVNRPFAETKTGFPPAGSPSAPASTNHHHDNPRGRYLGYLTGAEDYYTHKKSVLKQCPDTTDLWRGSSHSNGTVTQSRPGNESR